MRADRQTHILITVLCTYPGVDVINDDDNDELMMMTMGQFTEVEDPVRRKVCVCACLCFCILNEKRLELPIPKLVQL